jgi:phage gpG-like protein
MEPFSMGVKGDFGTLSDWEQLFRNANTLVETQSEELAEQMIELVKDGFDNVTDPYGRKWDRKKRPDGRPVLTGATGRLRAGWHIVSARRRGFHIAPSVEYAAYHQAPRYNRRPTRMMVPVMSLGLPPAWQRAMFPIALDAAADYFSGSRGRRTFRKA